MKTLCFVLHYNSTQFSDTLYEMLKPEAGEDYDLYLIDNGSDTGKESKYATHELIDNHFFGGALNIAFDLFLNDPCCKEYDSLLFLNSDLIVGKNFVKGLRQHLNTHDIISPSVIQPTQVQNYWPQMWNWGAKEIRTVDWVDLQAPLFSRRFVEKQKRFDDLLCYGWGCEIVSGITAKDNNMLIGVLDNVPVVHIGSATINDNKHKPEIAEYCNQAERRQWQYFNERGIITVARGMRDTARGYCYPPNPIRLAQSI